MVRECKWKETRRCRGDKHGLDQRGSGGGIENQLNTTWILKVEPAEFIRTLVYQRERGWVGEKEREREINIVSKGLEPPREIGKDGEAIY